jgi:hypothetical protein
MPNKADRYAWSMSHEDEAPLRSSWSGGDAPVAVESWRNERGVGR